MRCVYNPGARDETFYMLIFRNCEPKIINEVGKQQEHSDNRRLVVLLNLRAQAHSANQRSLSLLAQSSGVQIHSVQTTITKRSRLTQEPSAHSVKRQQQLVLVRLVAAARLDRITSSSNLPLDSVLLVRPNSLR